MTNGLKKRMNGKFSRMKVLRKLEIRGFFYIFGNLKDVTMTFFKKIKPSWIIHIFALLHAVVALSCRVSGVDDELLLTMLTMAMSLIICYKKGLNIEFTAAIIIVSNIIGYLIGTLGADLMALVVKSPLVVHATSTAVTTEILGWSIIALTKIFPYGTASEPKYALSTSYIKWILLAAGSIFIIRLGIVFFFSRELESTAILALTGKVMSNSVGLIILCCLNILFIRFSGKLKYKSKLVQVVVLVAFMCLAASIECLIVSIGFPFRFTTGTEDIPLLLIISLLAQITLYCIIYIINYALTTRSEMHTQMEKANMAQYRYLKLKRQVNPHFLFNSLNILDCLVCEEKTEQASTYIHKLAGIYRYMIKSEDDEIVQLRDELVFVRLYVDLLKVRFPEGFEVEIDVQEEDMARYVLPCSIQLLIENATKHNAVSVENPLRIRVRSNGQGVCVSNNVVPKVTKSQSTGLGHKYIRQQYMDLSGKNIEIGEADDVYCVTLPLL